MQYLMPHHLLFALFLFAIFSTSHAFNKKECESLLSLPLNTSSPPLNWSSVDCCEWDGISCDLKGRIMRIWLPFKGLRGSLPASLGNLTYLSHLNLSHNSLLGHLPKDLLSSLNQLKVLDLSYNHLLEDIGDTSTWPNSIQTFDISSNYFNGMIPSSFLQGAWRLIALNVRNNSFTGLIPSFPCINSSFIKILDFSVNQFSGQIPQGLGACSKLKVFRVGFNFLFGSFPFDIYNATGLEEISLPSNNVSGSIDGEIVKLIKLTNIVLHDNKLSGKLPSNIGNLSKLKYLLLDTNSLTGYLPSSLVNCTNLIKLILRDNLFEGDISTWNFSNLHQLTIVDMGFNKLSGSFPKNLFSCESLVAVRLSFNKIEGQIEPEVIQLKSLSFLSLSSNRLRNITRALKILMHCKNLSTVLLGGNFLHEAMPSDDNIAGSKGFENVQDLDLGNCQLTGQLPKWISTLKKLEVLGLAFNCITGSIPGWLSTLPRLFHLDLGDNLFSGEFPKELCTMPSLISLEAARENNSLNLPIFATGDGWNWEYKSLSNMKPAILLRNNNLIGTLPIEIGHLKQLLSLELSYNSLSGNIPHQIAELESLETLDLSTNQFSGEIPESLAHLHFLSYFNVAYNNLHGPIPLGSQLQSFDASAYEGNLDLCGPPLPKCVSIVKSSGGSHILNEEDRLGMPWSLVSVVLGFIFGFWGVCGPLLFSFKWRVAYFKFLNSVKDWFYVKFVVFWARLR